MKHREKAEVISFKADARLAAALNALDNRSEFIRQALRLSLDHQCPLCAGIGVLNADQQRHLRAFLQHHEIQECDRCHAVHLDDKPSAAAAGCVSEPLQQPAKRTKKPPKGRGGMIAGLMALLISGAQLVAAAHTHQHQHEHEHGEEEPAHASTCMLCVYAGTLMLAAGGIPVTQSLAPELPARSTIVSAVCHGLPFTRRARAPPFKA